MSIDLNTPPTSPAVAPNDAQKIRIRNALGLGTAATEPASFVSAKERVERSLLLDSTPTLDAAGLKPLDGDYTFYNVNYSIRNGIGAVTGLSLFNSYPDQRLNLNVPFKFENIAGGAFHYSEAAYAYAGHIRIPEGVSFIGAYAFTNLFNITSLELPSSLQFIDDNAFENWTGLNTLTLPENLLVVGSYSFYFCSALAGMLRLPPSLGEVNYRAFANCTGLDEVMICGELTSVAANAFEGCTLSRVYTAQNATTENHPFFPESTGHVYYKEGTTGWDQPPWDAVPSSVWTSYPDPMP